MNNDFASKLRKLREKKFPGQSLRRVGEILSSLADLGDYFFTQLNKMESGLLFPSPELLLKILKAYGAKKEEKKEILVAYYTSIAWERMGRMDEKINRSLRNEAVHNLYRRVKKKK